METYTKLTISLVIVAAVLVTMITLLHAVPIGADIYFHYEIARVWASGQNGMFSDFVLTTIHYPYPPFFHFILVPAVWLGIESMFARGLQLVLYPLGLATSMYFMHKHYGAKEAFWTGIILLGSIAFFDRLFQPIPQAIDIILFPLVVHTWLSKKQSWFVALCSILVWTHGLAALALIGGMLTLSLLNKRFKEVGVVALLTSPITVISVIYIGGGWSFWGDSLGNTLQELWFWSSPFVFTVWYLGGCAIGFLPVILQAWRWRGLVLKNEAHLITIASLMLMFVPWPDRFLTYLTLPLAYMLGKELPKRKWQPLIPLVVLCAIIFQAILWKWTFTQNFWTPP